MKRAQVCLKIILHPQKIHISHVKQQFNRLEMNVCVNLTISIGTKLELFIVEHLTL